MIVRISGSGNSFKGLATYLTHDPGARTAQRVAWTHTLNLANDHVPSAIDEMLRTSRNAELLKQEAGIRAGGRSTRNTVKHISLNWPPAGAPTKAQMIEAAETFLRHMNWQGHQAVLVAHNDRHPHLHLALNAVHPETGLKIDVAFERRRAQAWAIGYEQRQGAILCGNRLRKPKDREKAPPRNAWVAFEGSRLAFERDEKRRRGTERHSLAEAASQYTPAADEWRQLKEIQRGEREAFFAGGRAEFSALRLNVYRRLREAFRPRWAALYAAKKGGIDAMSLRLAKDMLIADQKKTLEQRRDKACRDVRSARDRSYKELLDAQADMRRTLRERQADGLLSTDLLDRFSSTAFGQPEEAANTASTEISRSMAQVGDNKDIEANAEPIVLRRRLPSKETRVPRIAELRVSGKRDIGIYALFGRICHQIVVPGLTSTQPRRPQVQQVQQLIGNGFARRAETPSAVSWAIRTKEMDGSAVAGSEEARHTGRSHGEEADFYDSVIAGVIARFRQEAAALRHSLPPHRLAAAIQALVEEMQAEIQAIKDKRAWMTRGKKPADRARPPHPG